MKTDQEYRNTAEQIDSLLSGGNPQSSFAYGKVASILKGLHCNDDMIHREQDIINWGLARNIIGPDSQSSRDAQHKKTNEEVNELEAAIDDDDLKAARDAIGDIIVTLVLQAQMWGLTITECLDAAWEEIRDRKGKMVDGIFVKESQ